MQDVIWSDRPELRNPVLVCAFKGWNDAGEAASAALGFIREQLRRRARSRSIDPEEFFDFTAVRPDGPADRGRHARDRVARERSSRPPVPGAERDLVMLQGVEPSLRWRALQRRP